MCGIAGLLHPDPASQAPLVARMLATIRHRGRDDSGLWQGSTCLLGHNRLSVIDLTETGHQPIANEARTVWAILNGEIYNYRELRDALIARGHRFAGTGDGEVIPHLYDVYGDDFVSHLRGMFAIALWDEGRRRLLLARDRVGKKPLFYGRFPAGLAFASEMKALFPVPGLDLSIRQSAIADYLAIGVVPGPATAYGGIRRVPPGHVMSWSGATAEPESRAYWQPGFAPKHTVTTEAAVDEIDGLLKDAVRLRLRADVPVGCFLSGGIDSGLVAAMAATALDRPLKTYCVGFRDDAFDERALARQVAARYGTDHRDIVLDSMLGDDLETVVGHYDEPYADASALPSFAVARLAANDLKVVLNGDGGDEVFAGYRHFLAARLASRVDRASGGAAAAVSRSLSGLLPAPQHGRSRYQFMHRFIRVLASDGVERFLVLTGDRLHGGALRTLWPDVGDPARATPRLEEVWRAGDGLGPVDAVMHADLRLLLADDHLVKMDIASMAHTLEARSPFLDHVLMDYATRLPESVKLGGKTTKPLLRALAERYLPKTVVHAPKRGFEVPLARWMRGDLNGVLHDRVLDPNSFAMTHFARRPLETLLAGRGWDVKRWSSVAWTLLCLEIWWRRYRDMTAATAATPCPARAVNA